MSENVKVSPNPILGRMFGIAGKVALVTGGRRGLCLAMAEGSLENTVSASIRP